MAQPGKSGRCWIPLEIVSVSRYFGHPVVSFVIFLNNRNFFYVLILSDAFAILGGKYGDEGFRYVQGYN